MSQEQPVCAAKTYLHTKTVGVAGSQQPDAVVTETIKELLEQVCLLLLALLLQRGVVTIWGILHTHAPHGPLPTNYVIVLTVTALSRQGLGR